MSYQSQLQMFKIISNFEDISNEILKNLSDLNYKDNNKLDVDVNDHFYSREIQLHPNIRDIEKYNLPNDFINAVYCLPQQEFWHCYRNNTFKEFIKHSPFKKFPHLEMPIPILLRTTTGICSNEYKNWIYNNRHHLLYFSRFEHLINSPYIGTDESNEILIKYADIFTMVQNLDNNINQNIDKNMIQEEYNISEEDSETEINDEYCKIFEKEEKEEKRKNRWYHKNVK